MTSEATKPLHKLDMTKAHQIYRNAAGKRVPGVTTILGFVAKPHLIKWANNLGLEGIDSSKFVDQMATIGTIAHAFCECHVQGMELDTSNLNPEHVDKAESSAIRFMAWWDSMGFKLLHSELQMVSEDWQVGGTLDIVAVDPDGKIWVIDLKTSKAIYPEHLVQCCAYAEMFEETHGDAGPVDVRAVVRIGKTEDDDDFEVKTVNHPHIATEYFGILVDAYRAKQRCERANK